MPDDPVLIAETQAWLRKAAHDLRAAGHSLTASPPLLDDVVFHCQQTAEKALKGFLLWNNIPFRKTHSLEEIGEQCLDLDSTLRDVVDRTVPSLNTLGSFGIRESPRNHPLRRRKRLWSLPESFMTLLSPGCPRNADFSFHPIPDLSPESKGASAPTKR